MGRSLAATASLFIVGVPLIVLASAPLVAACIIFVTAVVTLGVVFEYMRGRTKERLTEEADEKQRLLEQAEKDLQSVEKAHEVTSKFWVQIQDELKLERGLTADMCVAATEGALTETSPEMRLAKDVWNTFKKEAFDETDLVALMKRDWATDEKGCRDDTAIREMAVALGQDACRFTPLVAKLTQWSESLTDMMNSVQRWGEGGPILMCV